jgi:hypothetical protein
VKTAFRTRIKGNTSAGARVDWGLNLQGSGMPAIRLSDGGSVRGYHMGGAQATQQYRVQADCFGDTFKQAHDLGEELIALIEPAAGAFQGSFVQTDFTREDQTPMGPKHCRVLEFRVTHISA